MITKIKLDGEEHLAIVFNSSVSWEDLQSDVNGLLDLISEACGNNSEICTNAIYSAVNMIRYFQPSTSDALEMQKTLFGEGIKGVPLKLQTCEIYTKEEI